MREKKGRNILEEGTEGLVVLFYPKQSKAGVPLIYSTTLRKASLGSSCCLFKVKNKCTLLVFFFFSFGGREKNVLPQMAQ